MSNPKRTVAVPQDHAGTHLQAADDHEQREISVQYLMWIDFGAVWLKLAFNPVERFTWAPENVLLHIIGAHYTDSLVPYDATFGHLLGRDPGAVMGWQRRAAEAAHQL